MTGATMTLYNVEAYTKQLVCNTIDLTNLVRQQHTQTHIPKLHHGTHKTHKAP